MADKRPPKIGEFQERYTGKKTPKWLLDAYIQGSKSYNAKELKHKIIGYAEKNNLKYPQVVAQARGEANQIKNYLKKTVTPSGKNKARKPKVSGGGGMFKIGDTASSINRGTLSVAKKRQMNKGGLLKKAKKIMAKKMCPKCKGKGCSHCGGTGYHKTGMAKGGDMGKKPMNAGMAALKKEAPAVAKKMGYMYGGMTKKKGYNKGGLCGASNPAKNPVKRGKA